MKNSKRIIVSLLVMILIMISSMTLLVACVETPPVIVDNEVSVYIGDDNIDGAYPFTVDMDKLTESANVADMLAASPALYAEMEEGDYGMFLLSIGKLVPDSSYQFIAFYTTDTTADVSDEMETITHDDKTFYSANVGISGISVKAGESYAFVLTDYAPAPDAPIVVPVEADVRLNNLANAINVNVEPTIKFAETINTLLRSGVKFSEDFMADFKANVVAEMANPNEENQMASVRGLVIYSTSALLYAGMDIPTKAIEYINNGAWIEDGSAEWTCGVMLPVINELVNAGHDMTAILERSIDTLMAATVDGKFPMYWSSVDSAAVGVIALLPYYDRPEVKAIVDSTLRAIEGEMGYDNNNNNICGTAYALALAVECEYYGVENSLPTDALYEWILSKQDETGILGYAFENIQSLRALASYQINKNGSGTFFSYIK